MCFVQKKQKLKTCLLCFAIFLSCPVFAQSNQNTSSQTISDYAIRFDQAWRLVDERYWNLDKEFWQSLYNRYQVQAMNASGEEAFYDVLGRLYEELGDSHSIFASPQDVERIRRQYGDMPCLGIFSVELQVNSQSQADSQQQNKFYTYDSGLKSRILTLQDKSVGYIVVDNLATIGTARDLRQAVNDLMYTSFVQGLVPQTQDSVNAFILDLRGNPGGRLVEMMQAAGVFTSGFLWRAITSWTLPIPYPAIGTPATDLPLLVLINGDVNSAAEGLAGALQTTGRATLIGETTAGNVEAVLPFCLRDGSQAWIATGVLAPLRGATWEGRGVVPDIVTPSHNALNQALDFLSVELIGEESSGEWE